MKKDICQSCGKSAWVNRALTIYTTESNKVEREWLEMCAECFDRHGISHRRNPKGGSQGPMNNNDPWQDNAIRAMEGD